MRQLWNQKAKSFPRFKKDTADTLEILDFFASCGVSFKDKIILDIGCGNGRFTLQLAFLAKRIYGSDISESMLANLENDAKDLGLANVIALHSAWDSLDLSKLEPIELTFASMTPALNNKKSFEKALHSYTQGFCYVGWGRRRASSFLEPIFKEHNLTFLLPVGLPDVLKWLKELGYPKPKHCYKNANYIFDASREEAIEHVVWNIRVHDGEPDMEKITRYVDSQLINNRIVYEHEREIGVCFIPFRQENEQQD